MISKHIYYGDHIERFESDYVDFKKKNKDVYIVGAQNPLGILIIISQGYKEEN